MTAPIGGDPQRTFGMAAHLEATEWALAAPETKLLKANGALTSHGGSRQDRRKSA